LRFVAHAPYYKSDTFERILNKKIYTETIALHKDDYALMLHYFSTQKVKDWERRRKQLAKLFHEDAQIVQVMGAERQGVEMYTKEEFINKMTLPIKTLRNIKILATEYRAGQIIHVRFLVNN